MNLHSNDSLPTRWPVSACLALLLISSCATIADQKPEYEANLVAQAQFQRLAGMTGDWVTQGAHDGMEAGAVMSWRTTAGGSALQETLFAGSPHEMVSVYTMDGKDLMMTHYCMEGNQPHMRSLAGGSPDHIILECQGGGNMQSCEEAHMHKGEFSFRADGSVDVSWTRWEEGVAAGSVMMTLRRK